MCFFVSTAAPPLWCVVFMFPASSISVIIPISIGGSLNWCTYLLHKQLVHIGNITSAGQKDKLKKSRCRVREGGQGLLRRSFIGIRAEFPKSPKECKSVSKAEVIGIGFKGRVSEWSQVGGGKRSISLFLIVSRDMRTEAAGMNIGSKSKSLREVPRRR